MKEPTKSHASKTELYTKLNLEDNEDKDLTDG